MLLFEIGRRQPLTPVLDAPLVWLRPPEFGDFRIWTALRELSRDHLTAWEPAWRAEEMTPEAFRRRVRAQWREMRRGTAVPLLIFRKTDDALVGGITLSNVRLGPSRSAGLGYWIGTPFIRQGFARSALTAVLDHAFGGMELNRVEAACQPDNSASRRVLEGAGFVLEGRARNYLHINDAWRDHLLFAITADEFFAAGRAPGLELSQDAFCLDSFFSPGLALNSRSRDNITEG